MKKLLTACAVCICISLNAQRLFTYGKDGITTKEFLQAYNKNKAITLRTLRELQPGDYVTHIDHGVGVYSGLQKTGIERQTAGSRTYHL